MVLTEQTRLVVETALKTSSISAPVELDYLCKKAGYSPNSIAKTIIRKTIGLLRSKGMNIAIKNWKAFLTNDLNDLSKEKAMIEKTIEIYRTKLRSLNVVIERLSKQENDLDPEPFLEHLQNL